MAENIIGKFNSPVILCSTTIENLTSSGTIRKSATYKNAQLRLGRNEFRDIVLQMETPKLSLKFPLRDFQIHKTFMREGKITFHMKDHLTKVMVANAPPNSLSSLLKILAGKVGKKSDKKLSMRERLLSQLPKTFEEISPLTVKEFEGLRQLNSRSPLQNRNPNLGLPGASPVSSKRTMDQMGKVHENPSKTRRILSPIILNRDQKCVLSAVQSGYNVFFTGSAGTGKSFLLKKIVGGLPPDVTYVTASTGIAACHIGGTTLHSFAGIGTGTAAVEECINLAKRKAFLNQWKNCKHLIIDEISMVDGVYFKKMEAVARYMKGNDKPFGGIQLIICGDFFQLPPVSRKGENKTFCFQSSTWDRCINSVFELTEVKRQNDLLFIEILQELRTGRCSSNHEKLLKETVNNVVEKDDIKATRLCTHKENVEQINKAQLNELLGEMKTFNSVDSDPHLAETLDNNTPVLGKLSLKVGAQVMLMKNLDISQGLVNGARGVVKSFAGNEGFPVVKFACGVTKEIKHEKWTVKARGGLILTRRQIPLKLAWAFSIHKSQGMTLDCVEVSLSKVFEAGQAYVALSRARNLQSLRILDFSPSSIKAHSEVQRFYSNLKHKKF